jgi:hypothetical protein
MKKISDLKHHTTRTETIFALWPVSVDYITHIETRWLQKVTVLQELEDITTDDIFGFRFICHRKWKNIKFLD